MSISLYCWLACCYLRWPLLLKQYSNYAPYSEAVSERIPATRCHGNRCSAALFILISDLPIAFFYLLVSRGEEAIYEDYIGALV